MKTSTSNYCCGGKVVNDRHGHHSSGINTTSSTQKKIASTVKSKKRAHPGKEQSSLLSTSILNYIEQISIQFHVTKEGSDVRYIMEVAHLKLHGSWRLNRSFDEYRHFQKKLMKLLSHGHFCNAECPWLYTFMKSYFPKNLYLTYHLTKVLSSRREALERFFQAMQNFLLNRENHTCSIISHVIVREFVKFVYGYLPGGMPHPVVGELLISPSSKSNTTDSSTSSDDDEEDSLHIRDSNDSSSSSSSHSGSLTSSYHESNDICRLCQCSLVAEANCTSTTIHSPPLSSTSTTIKNSSKKKNKRTAPHPYATRLRCGHEFHDECIIPKLNKALACPTCGKDAA